MRQLSADPEIMVHKYKIHILIFLLSLFAALTLAHPALFVTDEWITVNQLAQIRDGHQVLLNEGKYGTESNGTIISPYFEKKENFLAYPLFLPIISLPALWFVELLDSFFIVGILYLWTFLLIIIALFLNAYFPDYAQFGKYRWTSGLIILAFFLFFLDLFFYRPFPVTITGSFPEIIAVVGTNILLFSLLAVMIYEIFHTIFENERFAFFGTVVSISCSSYLFWANFCKDHILVATLFAGILLFVVWYLQSRRPSYLYATFFLCGLLAWARPELAFSVCAALLGFYGYILFKSRPLIWGSRDQILLIISPVFTLLGAIPFFLNNYIFTKNIFIPAWIFWKTAYSPVRVTVGPDSVQQVQQASSDTIGTLIHLVISSTNLQPATVVSDFYGILLNPQSGSIGVLLLVPFFLIGLLVLPVLIISKNAEFSKSEMEFLSVMILFATGVFLAYFRGLNGMNVSPGVLPDIRYLSPIYLPLTIIGCLLLKNVPGLLDSPLDFLKGMLITWLIVIPPSSFIMVWYYPQPEIWSDIYPLLNAFFTIVTLILVIIFFIALTGNIFFKLPLTHSKYLLMVICALPLIWQVDASFLARLFGTGLGGYSFWIPVVRMYFVGIF